MPKTTKGDRGNSAESKKKAEKKEKSKPQRQSVEEEVPVQEDTVPVDSGERFISLSIISVMNLSHQMYQGSGVRFGVELGDAFRAYSGVVPVGEAKETKVDWNVSISCFPNTFEWRDLMALHPLHITLMAAEEPAPDGQGDSKTQLPPEELDIFGRSNLDLAPFLTGHKDIKQVLLVRQNKYAIAEELIPWPLSPKLTVTASLEEPLATDKEGVDNIFSITLESMYNLAPSLTPDLRYQARTCFPRLDGQGTLFDAGVWADLPSRERTKRWVGLTHVVGPGAFTNQNVEGALKKPDGFAVDETKLQARHVSHVDWNLIRRFYIPNKEELFIYIHKYGRWPLEIVASAVDSETGSESVKLHLAVFLDVSDLARPGETRTRVAGQVFTFSPDELEEKSSLTRSMFEPPPPPVVTASVVVEVPVEEVVLDANDKKGKNSKSKAGKPKSTVNAEPFAEEPNVDPVSAPPPSPRDKVKPVPLFASKGKPTFVIVDLELLRPLTERRVMRQYKVSELVPKRPPLGPHIMSIRLANEHFARCIEKATELVAKDYEKFKQNLVDPVFPDRQTPQTFSEYLVTTGTYQKVRETLKNKVATLIREKLGRGERGSKEMIGPFLENMHVHFTEKMRAIVKRFLYNKSGVNDLAFLESERIIYYAQEAHEEEGPQAARHMYLHRISTAMRNPSHWLDMAIFRALDNMYVAIECLRDALFLDSRHQMAILVYGVMTAMSNQLHIAETSLKYLVTLFPEFTRGWMTLYVFYSVSFMCPEAAELCLITAKRCWKAEKLMPVAEWVCLTRAPIVWNPDYQDEADLYMDTGVFLLKLNLTAYSEFAISQSMIHYGKTQAMTYYSAANLYQQGQFRRAMTMLAMFAEPTLDVVTLKGHCAYRRGDYEIAAGCFESAIDQGSEHPFVHMRLGKCYLKLNKVTAAKELFTQSWRIKISPETCLGVGVCLYRKKEYLEAERALTTGSSLSHSNAQIWAYLALVHGKLKRAAEFQTCYNQALRHNLNDEKLLFVLENLQLQQRGNSSNLSVCVSKLSTANTD